MWEENYFKKKISLPDSKEFHQNYTWVKYVLRKKLIVFPYRRKLPWANRMQHTSFASQEVFFLQSKYSNYSCIQGQTKPVWYVSTTCLISSSFPMSGQGPSSSFREWLFNQESPTIPHPSHMHFQVCMTKPGRAYRVTYKMTLLEARLPRQEKCVLIESSPLSFHKSHAYTNLILLNQKRNKKVRLLDLNCLK